VSKKVETAKLLAVSASLLGLNACGYKGSSSNVVDSRSVRDRVITAMNRRTDRRQFEMITGVSDLTAVRVHDATVGFARQVELFNDSYWQYANLESGRVFNLPRQVGHAIETHGGWSKFGNLIDLKKVDVANGNQKWILQFSLCGPETFEISARGTTVKPNWAVCEMPVPVRHCQPFKRPEKGSSGVCTSL
jgi:hypothetical protein